MKKPYSLTIIAFLKSKGWSLLKSKKDKASPFQTLLPPKEFEFDEPFSYQVPTNEKAIDYHESALRIVFSIAELYELNKWQLLDLLSKSIYEIKKDIEEKQKIVAYAS